MEGLAACRSLPRHEAEPGGEVPSAGEGAQIGREGHDGAGRDGPDAWHGAQATRLHLLLARCPEARCELFDPATEYVDLIKIEPGDLFHRVG